MSKLIIGTVCDMRMGTISKLKIGTVCGKGKGIVSKMRNNKV